MMLATVEVVPRAQYEQFIKERAANPTAIALGKEEWEHVCSVCHRLDDDLRRPGARREPAADATQRT